MEKAPLTSDDLSTERDEESEKARDEEKARLAGAAKQRIMSVEQLHHLVFCFRCTLPSAEYVISPLMLLKENTYRIDFWLNLSK